MKHIASRDSANATLNPDSLSHSLGIKVASCTASGLKEDAVETLNVSLEGLPPCPDFPRLLTLFFLENGASPFSKIGAVQVVLGNGYGSIHLSNLQVVQQQQQGGVVINVKALTRTVTFAGNDGVQKEYTIDFGEVKVSFTDHDIVVNFDHVLVANTSTKDVVLEVPANGSVSLSWAAEEEAAKKDDSICVEVPVMKGNLRGVCDKEWFYPLRKDEDIERLKQNRYVQKTKYVHAIFPTFVVHDKDFVTSLVRMIRVGQNAFYEIEVPGDCTICVVPNSVSLHLNSAVFYVSVFEFVYLFAKCSCMALGLVSDGKEALIVKADAQKAAAWNSWCMNMGKRDKYSSSSNTITTTTKIVASTTNAFVSLEALEKKWCRDALRGAVRELHVDAIYLHFTRLTAAVTEQVVWRAEKVFVNFLDGSWWVQPMSNILTCTPTDGRESTFLEFGSVVIDIRHGNNNNNNGNALNNSSLVSIRCLCALKMSFETPDVLSVAFLSLKGFAEATGILHYQRYVKKYIESVVAATSGKDGLSTSTSASKVNDESGMAAAAAVVVVPAVKRDHVKFVPNNLSVSVYDSLASPSFVSFDENKEASFRMVRKRNGPKVAVFSEDYNVVEDYHEEDDEREDITVLVEVGRIEVNLRNVYKMEFVNLEYKKAAVLPVGDSKVEPLTRHTFTIKDYNVSRMTRGNEVGGTGPELTAVLSNDRAHLPQYYVGDFHGTVSPGLRAVLEAKPSGPAEMVVFLQSFFVKFDGKLTQFLDNFTEGISGNLGGLLPALDVDKITLQPIPAVKFDCKSSYVNIQNAVIDVPQRTVLERGKSLELFEKITVLDVPGILLGELGKMSKIEILKDVSLSAKNPICSLVRVVVSAGKVIKSPICACTGTGAPRAGGSSTLLYEFTKGTTNFVSTLAVETVALGESLYTMLIETAAMVKNRSPSPVLMFAQGSGASSASASSSSSQPSSFYGMGLDQYEIGEYHRGWFGELYDKIPIFFATKK